MPSSNEIIVLGLDPGSRCMGWGVVREVSGQAELLEAGTIRINAKNDLGTRLGDIFKGVAQVIEKYQPHEAAVENVFVSINTSSALKLGQARGAAIAACAVRDLPVSGYEPTKVKKSIVGAGRAEKSQVAFMVGRILGCKPDWAEDASDALAVAVCHLNMRRFAKLTQATSPDS